ncbi:cupin domain-containing protein [Aeromicrobium sp. CF4.19]|uniref:cupin domain-containing protein n=1 Tax=Aeromicrobium sp. CF4.19 TaxID=3373082 RepID=UPI003EE64612
MSVSTTARVPGSGDDHRAGPPAQSRAAQSRSALSRLVADPAAFAVDVWGRDALLTPAAELPRGFEDVLDEAAVDELVSSRGLRTPFLRVARNGSTVPTGQFTSGAGAGAGIADQLDDTRLTALFADGATLVLQALHRTWEPVRRLATDLGEELGHPVQVNAYVTPPQSRGFDDHYDVHDVFVLQISGEKRWRIHAPVHPAPLRDQPWTDRRDAVATEAEREPVIDTVLRPGDCLYLPRGYLHAATALGDVSTHVTIGVHTWTRHALAEEMLDRAAELLAEDEDVRASLPLGVRVTDAADLDADVSMVRQRLHDAIDAVTLAALAARLAPRVDAATRPAPVGPLAQLRAAQSLGDDTVIVVLRPHVRARLEETDGASRLRSRAGVHDVAPEHVDAARRLIDGEPLEVAPHDESARDLVAALLAAGLVEPA